MSTYERQFIFLTLKLVVHLLWALCGARVRRVFLPDHQEWVKALVRLERE